MDIQKIQQYKSAFDAMDRAMEFCKTLKINVDDHFREVTKMAQLGSSSQLINKNNFLFVL